MLFEMEAMAARGHAVAAFATDHPQNLPSSYSRSFPPYPEYFASGLGTKVREAFRIIYSAANRDRFGEVIDQFKPDVVHFHNIYGQLSLSLVDAARSRGVRAVLTAHDYKIVCPSYQMLDHGKVCEKCLGGSYFHCFTTKCHKDDRMASAVYALESYFNAWTGKYGVLDKVISPSRFLMGKLSGTIRPEHLVLLRNAVELPPPAKGEEGYFLFAGRLSPEKGLWNLTRVFRETGLPLVVAGTGPLEAELRRSCEGSGIRFTGHVTGEELDGLYRGAQACVVPSEWYENAPLSVMEPMAYGKPVIGAAIGGIPELIQDRVTGRTFKAFDAQDLKRVVEEVAASPAAGRREMGRAAREWMTAECSPESHLAGLEAFYRA